MEDNSNSSDEQIAIEIETLESIYIHELKVFDKCEKYMRTIKVDLAPATGEDKSSQWVCMELWFYIPVGYPDTLPVIAIKNPRGLSDQRLQQIEKDLQETAESNEGMMMLFHLIEVAKDHLTKDNLPACSCAICLYGFGEDDVFVKTTCFHYFHAHCLSRYVKFQLDEIREKKQEAQKNNSPLKEPLKLVCPMCRLEMPEDIVSPESCTEAPPPSAQATDPGFSLTPELQEMQQQMARLYLQQKERGGIIDVEGERNKFFIQISNGTDEELERPRLAAQPAVTRTEAHLNSQTHATRPHPKAKMDDSSDSDSDSGCRGGRGSRGRRGKNGRMYPTPAEKKRAHLHALQQMRHHDNTVQQHQTQKTVESSTDSHLIAAAAATTAAAAASATAVCGAATGSKMRGGGRHRTGGGGTSRKAS